MRSHLAAMIILVATCGCQSRQAVPADILSSDKMEEVLFDMLRSGHMVNNFILSKDSSINKEQAQIEWLNKVLTFHAVSEQQFKKTSSPHVLSGEGRFRCRVGLTTRDAKRADLVCSGPFDTEVCYMQYYISACLSRRMFLYNI